MIINKITAGFVIQAFDTEKKKFSHQCFVAGDQVNYEDKEGNPMDAEEMSKVNFGPYAEKEPYLPFDMLQPDEVKYFGEKLVPAKSPTEK